MVPPSLANGAASADLRSSGSLSKAAVASGVYATCNRKYAITLLPERLSREQPGGNPQRAHLDAISAMVSRPAATFRHSRRTSYPDRAALTPYIGSQTLRYRSRPEPTFSSARGHRSAARRPLRHPGRRDRVSQGGRAAQFYECCAGAYTALPRWVTRKAHSLLK